MNTRELMINEALRWREVPYVWGGNSFTGVDCSGFVQNILKCIGKCPPVDCTAQSLLAFCQKQTTIFTLSSGPEIDEGDILFFGKSKDTITHVAISLNSELMIEAGGGDHTTYTADLAKLRDAKVRIRPIRKDLICAFHIMI